MKIKLVGSMILALLCMTISAHAAGDGIRLLSPNGGEKWAAGEEREITWSTTLPAAKQVSIHVVDTKMNWAANAIVHRIPNSGRYLWKIPDGFKPGSYKIRIGVAAGRDNDMSDGWFAIEPMRETALNILSPAAGERLERGRAHEIRWNKTAGAEDLFIVAWKSQGVVLLLTPKAANNGSFRWEVPADFPAGDYRIGIAPVGTTKVTYGAPFSIH
jgi:hypothetical protein